MMDDYGLEVAPMAVTALRDQLAAAERNRANAAHWQGVYEQAASRLRGEKETAERQHSEDIAAIGTRLLAEATEHGWCSDYDDVVDDLNKSLTVKLPDRVKTWRVEVTFEVSARSENDADDIIHRLYNASGDDVTDYTIHTTEATDY
jgi:hypothetical protein